VYHDTFRFVELELQKAYSGVGGFPGLTDQCFAQRVMAVDQELISRVQSLQQLY